MFHFPLIYSTYGNKMFHRRGKHPTFDLFEIRSIVTFATNFLERKLLWETQVTFDSKDDQISLFQYGFVNYALELLVLKTFGKETWETIK